MDNKYGNRIRALREYHKETLDTLASKVGLTVSALGKYERGERHVLPYVLEMISKVYDVQVNYFFDDTPVLNKTDIPEPDEWDMFKKEMENRNIAPKELSAFLSLLSKFNSN